MLGMSWSFRSRKTAAPRALTAAIAAAGASVQEIVHDRAFSGPDVFSTAVQVTVETADRGPAEMLFERLRAGTWMGHVLEHVTLELQTLAGTRWATAGPARPTPAVSTRS